MVVVSLGVNKGDSGRKVELPDNIKGGPFNDDERGAVTSLHDVLFGGEWRGGVVFDAGRRRA